MNFRFERRVALVVDDSPDTLSMVHDALEAAGFDVLVALDGKQALSISRKMKPDIVLMDGMMPGMDGFDACEALKSDSQLADIPVIFMTGLGDSNDIVRGLEVGGVDYLTKPIVPDELIARINVHLNNVRLTRSAHQALDLSGQMLMAVDDSGEQLWATPAAQVLLAECGVENQRTFDIAARFIRHWLQHEPDIGHGLSLKDAGITINAKLLSVSNNEYVLRLTNSNRESGAEILKSALSLTERESEVIYWIAQGKTNREAADILTMSPRTVNKHLEQIFVKLQVDNRTSAAGVALKVLAQAEALD